MLNRLYGFMRRASGAIGSVAGRAMGKTRGFAARTLKRIGVERLRFYAGLMLLLVVLGLASQGYRNRRAGESAMDEARPEASLTSSAAVLTEPEPTAEPIECVWPVEGEIIGEYAPDEAVWSATLKQWQTHPAIDIAAAPGEAVYACCDGVVMDKWEDPLWGYVIVIDCGGGLEAMYANLNTLELVEIGDTVEADQVVSAVGRSAACESEMPWHLHAAFTEAGQPVSFEEFRSKLEENQ